MPKYAILSDIHSNYAALEAVLAKCRETKVDHYLFLGDLVGYNADVRQCIDSARQLNFLAAVRGNHDDVALNENAATGGFNTNAAIAQMQI